MSEDSFNTAALSGVSSRSNPATMCIQHRHFASVTDIPDSVVSDLQLQTAMAPSKCCSTISSHCIRGQPLMQLST